MFRDNQNRPLSLEEAAVNSSLPKSLHSLDLAGKKKLLALKRRGQPTEDTISDATIEHWRFLKYYEARTGYNDTTPVFPLPTNVPELKVRPRRITISIQQ